MIEDRPIYKTSRLSVGQVVAFVSKLGGYPVRTNPSVVANFTGGCCHVVRSILDVVGLSAESGSLSLDFHYCALSMQLLTVGFSCFIRGYSTDAHFPLLNFVPSQFDLLSAGNRVALKLSRTEIACVGSMLQGQIFAFHASHMASSELHARDHGGAYLWTPAEDLSELWGPGVYFRAESPSD
jgi:hypothetical protein